MRVGKTALLGLALGATIAAGAPAQQSADPKPPARILEQDPSLDNLVDPPGYATATPGTLGAVVRKGDGDGTMVLIPGFGFGGSVFDSLVDGWDSGYSAWEVTLAGFGGTPAPPSPPPGTSFGEQTWTAGAVEATGRLLQEQGIHDAVLVGHWIGGTQVALEVARRHPDRVRAVILLSGAARSPATPPDSDQPAEALLERQIAGIDDSLAPKWFKTVTRETWDDNNFLPGDYAANPVLGLRLWREAARPLLHVWVRYLCEFLAQDATLLLDEIDAPILLVHPGLEGVYSPPGSNDYQLGYTRRSWGRSLDGRANVRVVTLPDTRIVMWADRPDAVRATMAEFLTEPADR